MRRLLALVALVAVPLLVLAACGSDDDDDNDGASEVTTTTDADEPTESTTTTAAEIPEPTSAPTTVPACDPGTAPSAPLTGGDTSTPGMLTSVTVVDDGACVDTVAFAFTGAVPGYSVEYQPGPFQEDGSGEPAAIAGSSFVVVRFEPGYTYDFEQNVETYTGDREIVAGAGPYVVEIENTGDFEAVLTWVIGLTEPAAVVASVEGTTLELAIGNPG